ncbi:MAG: hypothetical protein ACPGDB_03495 [Fusobacterium sp.]
MKDYSKRIENVCKSVLKHFTNKIGSKYTHGRRPKLNEVSQVLYSESALNRVKPETIIQILDIEL